LHQRIKKTQIFNRDALKFIRAIDSPATFFYVDPPYVNTDQGHYSGYTEEEYLKLLETLENLKGSFILSGYETGLEPKHWKKYTFQTTTLSASYKKRKERGARVEVLWLVDHNGGIEDEKYRKIYAKEEFQKIWPFEK